MKVKIDFSLDQPSLKKLSNLLDKKLLSKNVSYVMREIIGRKYIEEIMIEFDEFSLYFDPEDPAAPEHWRDEFQERLLQELHSFSEETTNKISISLGDKDFFGYNEKSLDPKDDTPLVWFVFYMEGLVGEYAFVDENTFHSKRGPKADLSKYGRFGRGFMLSKDDYEAEGWSTFKSFEEAKFPFSGEKPKDFFREAWNKLDLNPNDLKKAVIATLQGRTL